MIGGDGQGRVGVGSDCARKRLNRVERKLAGRGIGSVSLSFSALRRGTASRAITHRDLVTSLTSGLTCFSRSAMNCLIVPRWKTCRRDPMSNSRLKTDNERAKATHELFQRLDDLG